jgi:predicted nucleic acid-binding protein
LYTQFLARRTRYSLPPRSPYREADLDAWVAAEAAKTQRGGPAFDLPAARILATYRVPEHAPYDDALISAVAQAARKIVVTRNIRHFEPLGVPCLDHWSDR